MAKVFTFKKQKPDTGLAAVGSPYPDTDIKHNKLVVGYISAPTWRSEQHKWRIHFMRETDTGWEWVNLARVFDAEPDARDWINKNAETVLAIGLHHEEPD